MLSNTQGITIIDYGMGNLNSIKRKLDIIGCKSTVTNNYKTISKSSKLILPGVGHFEKAINNIKDLNLWDVLNELVLQKQIPILGICLGMQLMAILSEEGAGAGFGWFDGEVQRFKIQNTLNFKIPHIGWNQVEKMKESLLFNNIDNFSEFYFVHSFHFVCNNPIDVLGQSEHEYKFPSAIEKNNIYGVQFHPEKSHEIGEKLLRNFIKA